MKRFWLVLLSLGLVMAFSASAFAVDVKVSGSYYAAGVYLDQKNLNENTTAYEGQSTAFYFTRLRVGTELVVSPGLSLITRFDALERVFGQTRTSATATDPTGTASLNSAGTRAENENIAFDYAYVKYATPIGTFQVGAQPGGTFGLAFANSEEPRYRVKYISPDYSGFTWTATIEKNKENSYSVVDGSNNVDADADTYYLTGDYKKQNWAVGLLYGYTIDKTHTDNFYTAAADRYKATYHTFNPYATAAFGPVKLSAELKYVVGERDYETSAIADKDIESFGAMIDAVATFGPIYVGGTIAYADGDVDTADDTVRGIVTGGMDWSPTLIMWNEDRARWVGSISSTAAGVSDGFDNAGFANAWLYQLRVGVKPIEKLDVCFAVSYAERDRVNDNVDKPLGWEFDLTGTYKITNNLTYMLGAGYLVTGDYFKGTNQASEVENNYMIINKLALTF
ncbi:MAG: hypothetical protein ABFD75_02220 [Smithella sp.]